LHGQTGVARDRRERGRPEPDRALEALASKADVTTLEQNVGPIEETSGKPPVGSTTAPLPIGPGRRVVGIELLQQTELFIQVRGAGLEAVGRAGFMPADGNAGPRAPGRGETPGQLDPEVPVEGVAIRRVEAPDRYGGLGPDRHGRAPQ